MKEYNANLTILFFYTIENYFCCGKFGPWKDLVVGAK
jgi:hypothetical protein